MPLAPPAQIGDPLEAVDTPALLLDLDALDRNLADMAAFCAQAGVALRAHAKTHKSPDIARLQLAHGAVGFCCQKVSEAEVMVQGGLRDLTLTNEVVGAAKARRLAQLATQARITACADHALNVTQYNAAAGEAGVELPVLVDVDIGFGRCGVQPGAQALALARQIADAPHLRFAGLQAYHGATGDIEGYAAREAAILDSLRGLRDTRALLEQHGLPCPVVTGGSSGGFQIEAASGVYTELQCGSYIFMDEGFYTVGREKPAVPDPRLHRFQQSLHVLVTVMNRHRPTRAIVDAGLKALSTEWGGPVPVDQPGVTFSHVDTEHGYYDLEGPGLALKLGDRLQLMPSHCDPQVNLFDWYVGIRQGRVEALWPVAARGAAQ